MKKIILTFASLMIVATAVNAQTVTKTKREIRREARAARKEAKAAAERAEEAKQVTITAPAQKPNTNHSVPAPTPPLPVSGNSMPTAPAVPQEVYDFDKYAKLDKTEYDFGNNVKQLAEGVNATYTIKNISKEPLIIENVQPTCGCTVSTQIKDPIAPGKSASFTINYHSQGRPGPFTKSVTVRSNRGMKSVTFRGTVEANAPAPTPTPGQPGNPAAGH